MCAFTTVASVSRIISRSVLTSAARGGALACIVMGMVAPAHAQDPERLAELIEAWLDAPHGDYGSASFTHWNEEGEVPVECAACHSEPGLIDFLGADGTAAGQVDRPAAINAPIGCPACHTGAAHDLDAVNFPSGVAVAGLGGSATCTVCHQGRTSGTMVDAALAGASGQDEDAVLTEQGFVNIHYSVAAATLNGADTRGGYHYAGQNYAGRFVHVPSANTCVACHEPHSTEVATEGCLACHRGVDDPRDIRTRHTDFDGDGDTAEGIHAEIETMHLRLAGAISAYGAEVAGAPIGYNAGTFPYFFNDGDADGEIGAAEAVFPNRYQNWTPRLLKAAYNYQMVAKDPGGYAHNPTYLLQLMHDSLQSLAEQAAIDVTGIRRP